MTEAEKVLKKQRALPMPITGAWEAPNPRFHCTVDGGDDNADGIIMSSEQCVEYVRYRYAAVDVVTATTLFYMLRQLSNQSTFVFPYCHDYQKLQRAARATLMHFALCFFILYGLLLLATKTQKKCKRMEPKKTSIMFIYIEINGVTSLTANWQGLSNAQSWVSAKLNSLAFSFKAIHESFERFREFDLTFCNRILIKLMALNCEFFISWMQMILQKEDECLVAICWLMFILILPKCSRIEIVAKILQSQSSKLSSFLRQI